MSSDPEIQQLMGQLCMAMLVRGYDVDGGCYIESHDMKVNHADVGGWRVTITRTRKPEVK